MRQSRPSTTFMAGRDFAYPLFGDVAERRDDSGEPATHSATERSDVAERIRVCEAAPLFSINFRLQMIIF
jgi:hypothetical protein